MEISYKKFKEESSKFYKIGYRTGYQTACRALEKMEAKDIPLEDERFKVFISECIEQLLKYYNSYPCIEHLFSKDISDENI